MIKTMALLLAGLTLLSVAGCVPRIEVSAPKAPITIDMNVKIDHQITIKADKNVDKMLKDGQ